MTRLGGGHRYTPDHGHCAKSKTKEDEYMKKIRSKKLLVARNMPPLYHTIPGKNFDIAQSEVVKWLIAQPDILNYIWDNIKNSGDVFYNTDTGNGAAQIMRRSEFESQFFSADDTANGHSSGTQSQMRKRQTAFL